VQQLLNESGAKAWAKAGKHIFCERPIATDLKGEAEAIQLAKNAGIELMTASSALTTLLSPLEGNR
jgi:Oxidoreductase family, NAD-binding Rossmann fold